MGWDKQTTNQANKYKDRHINTMTQTGLRAWPSENKKFQKYYKTIPAKEQTISRINPNQSEDKLTRRTTLKIYLVLL